MKSIFDTLFPHGAPAATSTTVVDDPQVGLPAQSVAPQVNHLADSTVNPILASDMDAISHLDARSNEVIVKATDEAKRLHKTFIEPEQLLFGLLSDRAIFELIGQFSVNTADLVREIQNKSVPGNFTGEPTMSDSTKQILEQAYAASKKRGADFVVPEDMLLSMFSETVAVSQELKAKGVEKAKVEEKLSKSSEFSTGKKSVLAQYGVDLVQKAEEGKLDPITGRDNEIARVTHILLRRSKNNPIIIGEAGVGKTAIIEGLAQLIASGQVPPDLKDKKIIQLDVSSLIAGASHRGEFEERLQNVIKEAMASSGQVILFIDEIHTLIGAGDSEGNLDASNIIKPYLSRGQLQVIGTTTTSEYRKKFEKDRAFERRFQAVMCPEPSEEEAIKMAQILQPKYEAYHKVTFLHEAIEAAVKLSKRYIGERYLPDKAIDLLDEAASEVRLAQSTGKRADNQVKSTDIENVVSRWTGIPISKLTEKESEKLLHLEELIHKNFINQNNAVKSVSEAVRRGRIGLANINRPIASFIFLGPTGTGKTELAKCLAEIMFGRKDATIRLDMSEYMEKHEVAKLVGAPPGYVGYEEGGQLTEAVRTKPYSIVLLDEIEKAHPDVFNILLQLLEDGRLTDNKGNTVSFKNTIIICTSNIGSDLIRQKLQEKVEQSVVSVQPPMVSPQPTSVDVNSQMTASQAGGQKTFAEMSKLVTEQLNKFFKPELLNRFDEIVIFEPLSEENMFEIAKLGIENTRKMLGEQKINLEISQAALKQLAKEGYDPVYGARPLRRLIQRSIENPIAIYLIKRSIQAGETVTIDFNEAQDKFVFSKISPAPTISANTAVPNQPAPVQTPPTQSPPTPLQPDPAQMPAVSPNLPTNPT